MTWILAVSESGLRSSIEGVLSALYTLVLSFGGPGLLLLALADSSFLSVPEGNDLLIVVLSTGQTWWTMAYYVAMTTIGSVIGCSLLYMVGRHGGGYVSRKLDSQRLQRAGHFYRRWGSLAIIVPSILPPPTPFKVFVLSAGVFGIAFPKFLLSVLIGRSFRYSMWGVLAVLFGERAKHFLETNLHLAGLILLLVFAGGITIYLLLRRRRGAQRSATEGDLV